ncbi:MAG: metalloregulator ArsR/SmtB family transcription factor [Methylacidiphilales bacterium]|nr:metalloregulator ArsR/SmtB family transcription factor [Candidatus Methylacidiphilales bacterium]MDW8349678.1 metalloregulator ArsR/SmtB family transcription factor [Verrucomicrobiae bacterium]
MSLPSTQLQKIWHLLSDITRLRLYGILSREELSVAEIQQVLGQSQSTISNHLALMRQTQLVESRRQGKHIYYKAEKNLDPVAQAVTQAAMEMYQALPEAQRDQAALQVILRQRQQAAQNFFNKIAGKMGEIPCPGRSWQAVGPLLAQLVPDDLVIADLGAGEGWLSQLLAQRAKKVIAVDISPKMIAVGQAETRAHGIKNLEFRQGDIVAPPIAARSVDIVLLSQALHHVPSPPQAIAAAFKILKPKGRILILDLMEHHVDQARELYGDYWLGFKPTDLHLWLREIGYTKILIQLLEPENVPPHFQPILAVANKP